jgi:hypothetical protein
MFCRFFPAVFLFAMAVGFGLGDISAETGTKTFTAAQLKLPGKKGACFTLRERGEKNGGTVVENMPKVKALNPSWNYSWGMERVREHPALIEFVPMVWGASSKEALEKRLKVDVVSAIKNGNVKRFLGFNEPDKEDQSNMPYTKALELWPTLEKLGVPLCSPACANPEGVSDESAQGVPGTWMRDFMKEADKRGYRVDYIGVHWYGGTDAAGFKAKMKKIYEKYGRRPLLITEFAPADWKTGGDIKKHKHKPESVLKFMKDVLPWMEEQDWISGYSWFSFHIESPQGTSSALFDKMGNLTACGQFYRSVTPQNPKGDQSIRIDSKQ